jgi:hypothetical protein
MDDSSTTTKLAWIKDGEPGARSLGHFNCPCGFTIPDVEYASRDCYGCTCGNLYGSTGWLLS